MTTPLKDAVDAAIELAALAYARKWRLIDGQGQIWCANEHCQRLALLPSLHCPICLGAHYARFHITMPWCPNREQRAVKEVA